MHILSVSYFIRCSREFKFFKSLCTVYKDMVRESLYNSKRIESEKHAIFLTLKKKLKIQTLFRVEREKKRI